MFRLKYQQTPLYMYLNLQDNWTWKIKAHVSQCVTHEIIQCGGCYMECSRVACIYVLYCRTQLKLLQTVFVCMQKFFVRCVCMMTNGSYVHVYIEIFLHISFTGIMLEPFLLIIFSLCVIYLLFVSECTTVIVKINKWL